MFQNLSAPLDWRVSFIYWYVHLYVGVILDSVAFSKEMTFKLRVCFVFGVGNAQTSNVE